MYVTPIHKSVYRITTPFGDGSVVFLYLLKGDRVALVDTGTASSPREVLRPALAEIGLALSDVDAILITHAHQDHVGGNREIKAASGAPIHVHSGDLPLAQSTDFLAEYMVAPMRALDFPPEAVRQRLEHTRKGAGEPAGADSALADGQVVDLGAGVEVRVVHCPGHTPGSVCFYWESEGLLIAGDAVQGLGSRPGGFPLYFDAPAYRHSLDIMAALQPRYLCLGHAYLGGGVLNDPVRVGDDTVALLKESMRVADTIHRVVADQVAAKPNASRREVALAALAELIYDVPTLLVRGTDMPGSGAAPLLAHIEAALAGGYPE